KFLSSWRHVVRVCSCTSSQCTSLSTIAFQPGGRFEHGFEELRFLFLLLPFDLGESSIELSEKYSIDPVEEDLNRFSDGTEYSLTISPEIKRSTSLKDRYRFPSGEMKYLSHVPA
mgnify:CR=1